MVITNADADRIVAKLNNHLNRLFPNEQPSKINQDNKHPATPSSQGETTNV